ncbi:hypothetical protein ACFL0W_00535 [Nanoarchaeota archaeon]
MGCYIVPTVAAIVHYFMREKIPSMKNSSHHVWLNLLFVGGSIFGIVDHLWNGELFMLGEKLFLDITLGVTITLVIIIAWKIITVYDKLQTPNKVSD